MADYDHKLSPADVEAGIKACFTNAERLLIQAMRALDDGDFGLALFLGNIRIEEFSKIFLLLEVKRGRIPGGTWKGFWRRFNSHAHKWLLFKLKTMKRLPGLTDGQWEKMLRGGEHKLKDFGLYVGQNENTKQWLFPWDPRLKEQAPFVMTIGEHALRAAIQEIEAAGVPLGAQQVVPGDGPASRARP